MNWIHTADHRLRNGARLRSPLGAKTARLSSRTLTGSDAGSVRGTTAAKPTSSPTLRKKRVYAAPTMGSYRPSGSRFRSFQLPSGVRHRVTHVGGSPGSSTNPVFAF